jgi:hypothetical protein
MKRSAAIFVPPAAQSDLLDDLELPPRERFRGHPARESELHRAPPRVEHHIEDELPPGDLLAVRGELNVDIPAAGTHEFTFPGESAGSLQQCPVPLKSPRPHGPNVFRSSPPVDSPDLRRRSD